MSHALSFAERCRLFYPCTVRGTLGPLAIARLQFIAVRSLADVELRLDWPHSIVRHAWRSNASIVGSKASTLVISSVRLFGWLQLKDGSLAACSVYSKLLRQISIVLSAFGLCNYKNGAESYSKVRCCHHAAFKLSRPHGLFGLHSVKPMYGSLSLMVDGRTVFRLHLSSSLLTRFSF